MYHTPIKDIVSLKSLIDVAVWPLIKNKGHLNFIPKQKYFTDITKTEKAGGILAYSENQKVLSLKNLRIQLSILQEAFGNTTENSWKYTKLAQQFFQKDFLLTGNLLGNKGFAIGESEGYTFLARHSVSYGRDEAQIPAGALGFEKIKLKCGSENKFRHCEALLSDSEITTRQTHVSRQITPFNGHRDIITNRLLHLNPDS